MPRGKVEGAIEDVVKEGGVGEEGEQEEGECASASVERKGKRMSAGM